MEPQASGGWQAAIDPSLAARLIRPAVRPGVSDPVHGRTLAARLQRMAAPTLADDVARRYGATLLDAGRPPVVYATPPIQPLSTASRRDGGVPSGPLRKGLDAGRAVVQGTVRATGPVFPPLRPLDAGPAVQGRADPVAAVQRMADPAAAVQRMADPAAVQRKADPRAVVQRMTDAAAAVPVVVARRIGIETAGGASTGPRGAERSVSTRPVVAPAPTRLQRQIAAEHAQAVPAAAPVLPRVQATWTAAGGGTGGDAPAAVSAGGHAVGSASPGATRGAAGTDVVQRRIDPAASHPPRLAGDPPEPEGMPATPASIVLAAPGGGGGSDAAGLTGAAALPVALPTGRGGGMDGVPIQMVRAHPAGLASPPGGTGEADGGGRSAARPVVVARSGSGGAAVQRRAIQGAAPGLPAARMVHAAPSVVVQRMDATTTPPATLPTMTAGDAPGTRDAGGGNPADLAEQVYGILVRRLESERKQRGW